MVRVIPVITIMGEGVYRTLAFKKPQYVGDPLNTIKIFNEKEVDEIVLLDIGEGVLSDSRIAYLSSLASRAFMPMAYGGKIDSLETARKIFRNGFEKVVINSAFFSRPQIVKEISEEFGSQAVVVSLDVGKTWFGREVLMFNRGFSKANISLENAAVLAEKLGAGELYIRSIGSDGTMLGYDCDLVSRVAKRVDVPVVAIGGAGNLNHFKEAPRAGAQAVAAGSMFVYQGPRRGVLINYPSRDKLKELRS